LITIIDLGSEIMKKENKIIVLDVILVVISLYLALLLKFDFRIQPDYIEFFLLSIIPVVVLTIIFNVIFKLYSNIWKYASVEELLSIVYSMTASNIAFIIYGYFISHTMLKSRFFYYSSYYILVIKRHKLRWS